MSKHSQGAEGIAVIGMAGRYPGADNLNQFWQILSEGRDGITRFTAEQLLAAGYDAEVVSDPTFVKARPAYRKPMRFDAAFFGYSPREAEIIDPQQRIFLECAWEALEDAGYDPLEFPGPIGLYGGSGMTTYGTSLYENSHVMSTMGSLAVATSNERDYFATRVGYKLNLRGPCVTVQTACSTALVGISFACQSLLSHQTDLALGGGATIQTNDIGGYFYTEGGIVSPDGYNRAFDKRGRGTIFGSGAGVVVLKRLREAVAHGDNIQAVILGYGVNNDGSAKVGFTAPSVDGQAAACLEALAMAGVHPETISYIECHGTATPLGDLVEISALNKAFRAQTKKRQFCAVGSVKTNIGHMDSAAGVAGFTKAVLALKHRTLPPNLHFETPNPDIDFDDSPFYVNTKLAMLQRNGAPLRAGISSFGVGGTNSHVVIEEAPDLQPSSESRPFQLLVWSAKTTTAMEQMTANLADHLESHPELPLADVSYTLQVGRRVFGQRGMTLVRSREEAIAALRGEGPAQMYRLAMERNVKDVVFVFPGQGAQHVGMARELYESEPVFTREVDRCCDTLTPHLRLDLRSILYPVTAETASAENTLRQTEFAQPALFVIEYALAKLWEHWGVKPVAMVGHSIGEYVAACLAGVFSVEDALRLVAERGRLMQSMPVGAMLAVMMREEEVKAQLKNFAELSIAAINAPESTVVSGPLDAIAKFEAHLEQQQLPLRRLLTSHAFHSSMMEPMLAEFRSKVEGVKLSAPTRAYLSNLTGKWATLENATDPDYWVQHLRLAVRFSDNVAAMLSSGPRILLEVGPGRGLGSLISQHPSKTQEHTSLASLPDPKSNGGDYAWVLTTIGRLWLEGKSVDWKVFYAEETRRRISLPTYPFDHEEYVVEPQVNAKNDAPPSPRKIHDVGKWFHCPTWKRAAPLPAAILSPAGCAMLFLDEAGLGDRMASRLERAGWDVICVRAGDGYTSHSPVSFTIRAGEKADYELLLNQVAGVGFEPSLVFHLWSVTAPDCAVLPELECYEHFLDRGFMSIMNLAPNLNSAFLGGKIRLCVVGNELHDVTGNDLPIPTKAVIIGPCRAALAECPNIDIHTVDIEAPTTDRQFDDLIERLLAEAFSQHADEMVAYRGGYRWLRGFDHIALEAPVDEKFGLRDGGVYLITGGLGGIGLVIAEGIAARVECKLALFSRSALPPRHLWDEVSMGKDVMADRIRRLLRIEALGSAVLLFTADVSNLPQMTAAVERIETEMGSINGVFHSAGTSGGGVMLLKTREQINEVLLPKIKGTLILEKLVKDKALDFFLLCSSLNAFLGEGGLSDYIGANAFIDAFAFSRKHLPTPPLAIQWDNWEEVGMLARGFAASPKIDWSKRIVEDLDHPIFAARISQNDFLIYTKVLDPDIDWVIGEHELMGSPTLVGTTVLQWASSAFLHASGQECVVELRDVLFLSTLVLSRGSKCKIEVALQRHGKSFEFAVRSCMIEGENRSWVVHAIGKATAAAAPTATHHDRDSILARCGTLHEMKDLSVAAAGVDGTPFLRFSDRWNCVKRKAVGRGEALAELRLDERFHEDFDIYGLHPAVLDRATSFEIAGANGAHYLPFGYNRVRISSKLSGLVYSHLQFESGDEFLSSNVTIFDVDGVELLYIEGYELKRVPQDVIDSNSAERVAIAPLKTPEPQMVRPSRGIVPAEGMEVFRRLLGAKSLPQIAVACRDLRVVQAEIREMLGLVAPSGADKGQAKQTLHPRPSLPTPYVEPRNELEGAIAQIWGSMLGIEKVGIHDDFLELGGNSLLGIQVASRIRAEFEVELSLATFYKAPTVGLLAESVLETLQAGVSDEELRGALDEIERADARQEPALL